MDTFSALLAWLAITAIFATIVTIVVDLIHKTLDSRRRGLRSLFRATYRSSIAPHLKAHSVGLDDTDYEVELSAQQFAQDMMTDHGIVSGWIEHTRNLPLLSLITARPFERMSQIQFAEQLARTAPGRLLQSLRTPSGARSDLAITEAIAKWVYEFERLGETARDRFRSEARRLAVVVGLLVAILFNVDLVNVFSYYQSAPDRAQAATQTALVLIQSGIAGSRGSDADEGLNPTDVSEAIGSIDHLLNVDREVPIGLRFYPYCYSQKNDNSPAQTSNAAPSNAASIDKRCYGVTPVEMNIKGFIDRLVAPPQWGEHMLWMLSLVLAAGAFGLGAPFWFDAFRSAMSLAGRGGEAARQGLLDRSQASQRSDASQPREMVNPQILRAAYDHAFNGGLERNV